MNPSVAINGRFLMRRLTGVDRYAHKISKRITFPKRFIQPRRSLGQVSGHLWEQFILPASLKKDEILWSPANSGAWAVSNQIVTIHDASVFDHPEWFKPAFGAWTRLSWKILAKRVKAIITVSEFSKQKLQQHLHISNEKIHVIYNGVGKPFEPQSANSVETVKQKYGIKKDYFLFVGTIEPRKNLDGLLSAWKQAKLASHQLFIAGATGSVFAPTDHTPIATHIPDEDLPALYSGATALINPSFYEGFGLTALEAMACGIPVIASNTTAFPEILGDAALLIDPRNSSEIADAMKNIIENNSLASDLRKRGLQRASQFSWEESARKTQEIMAGVL